MSNGWVQCPVCGGTRICQRCRGTGNASLSGGFVWCPVQCTNCNGAGRVSASVTVGTGRGPALPIVHPSLVEAAHSEIAYRASEQARARKRLAVGAIAGVAAIAGGEWLADRIRRTPADT
jgi:DnaJ-class molecular chaperone